MKEKKSEHLTIGNVTYLWGEKASRSEADSLPELPEFDLTEQTSFQRLKASLSGTWTPGKLKAKIAAQGFSGEKAEQIFEHLSRGDSYDALWVATREVGRRLKKGQGEQRLQVELRAAGFDDQIIVQALQAVSDDDWNEALTVAMQSSSIRSKEGPALKQALARRGFTSSRIQSFLKRKGDQPYESGSYE